MYSHIIYTAGTSEQNIARIVCHDAFALVSGLTNSLVVKIPENNFSGDILYLDTSKIDDKIFRSHKFHKDLQSRLDFTPESYIAIEGTNSPQEKDIISSICSSLQTDSVDHYAFKRTFGERISYGRIAIPKVNLSFITGWSENAGRINPSNN